MTRRRLSIWAPLPATVYLRKPPDDLPYPLEEPTVRLYALARHALWHGVRALSLSPGDTVLVPAYHHGSEIEALREAGLVCAFYEGDDDLEPREDELEALITDSVRALYIIHYLGFPQRARRWREWCDAHGLLLFEDAAQAWLSQRDGCPVGSFGELAIWSLYKTVGLPEGALLRSAVPPPKPQPDPRFGTFALIRRHAAWLAQSSRVVATIGDVLQSQPLHVHEREIGLGDPAAGAWRCVEHMLTRAVDESTAARRRANYLSLLDRFGDVVPAPFGQLPDGATPFAFPLEVAHPESALADLQAAGVHAARLWSQPHAELPEVGFERVALRRRHTILLPVHQELRGRHVRAIATAGARLVTPHTEPSLEEQVSVDSAREVWEPLARATRNVFATWEWASTWWDHFGSGRDALVMACRLRTRTIALLPLYLAGEHPIRLLRFIGHGVADQLGPICHPSDSGAAARAMRRLLDERARDADVLLAERLRGQDAWAALTGGVRLRRESFPVLHVGGRTWDEYLSTRSTRFRQRFRWRERALSRDHGLRLRLSNDPERLDDDLAHLFRLHMHRWGEHSSGFATERRAFHIDFARRAHANGWLRLWIAELDGQVAAAWYGFRFAGVESHYQSGWDPRFARTSIGSFLVMHSIRAAFEDGMHEYRFLLGDETHKWRYADSDPGVDTIAMARGTRGVASIGAATLLARTGRGRRLLAELAG